MTLSFALIGLWLASTLLIHAGPRRWHWPVAWGIIVAGVPLVGWVTWAQGPLMGLGALTIGISALRPPVKGLMR